MSKGQQFRQFVYKKLIFQLNEISFASLFEASSLEFGEREDLIKSKRIIRDELCALLDKKPEER